MKIGILGAGSVGLGVAASLGLAGIKPLVIARGASATALAQQGISVKGNLGDYKIPPENIRVTDGSRDELALDLLMVTTKSYEVTEALRKLKFKGNIPAVLLLQNGWGSSQEVRAALPQGTKVFSGIVMSGLERTSPTEVQILAHVDAVKVGALFGDALGTLQALFDASKGALLPFVREDTIEPVIFAKLLYNCCLNPLGAILHCTYGEALKNEKARLRMFDIAEEGIKVLAAAHDYRVFSSGRQYVEEVLVGNLLKKIGAHRSSMLQDLETGRRTEIDYLNGAIVAMGKAKSIETPVNQNIVDLIHAAEQPVHTRSNQNVETYP